MVRIISGWITLWLLLLLAMPAQAQTTSTDTLLQDIEVVEAVDEEDKSDDNSTSSKDNALPAPHEVIFTQEDLQPVRKQKEFAYMSYIDSVLRHQKVEPEEKKVVQQSSNISLEWLKPLLWTIAILGLLFLLYKIWTDNAGLFSPSDKKKNDIADAQEEDPLLLHGAAELAQQAIQSKEYRMATRYLFIDTLARLDEKGLIQRIARKTNQQYLQEIQQPELKETLATAMLHFEYVWYGEFTPSESQFQRIHQTFKQLEVRWL